MGWTESFIYPINRLPWAAVHSQSVDGIPTALVIDHCRGGVIVLSCQLWRSGRPTVVGLAASKVLSNVECFLTPCSQSSLLSSAQF